MDDDPDTMLRQTLIICGLFWLGAFSLVFLPACTPTIEHQVTVPLADKIVDKIAALPPPVTCRKLDLPQVPADVVLTIHGDKITANAGGETVLRGFVACRSLYRDAPGTGKP
jgi:hypothetical protein